MRWLTVFACSGLLAACGQAAAPPPNSPTPPPPPSAAPPATPEAPAAQTGPVPAPPPECQALVEHTGAEAQCGQDRVTTLELLADALEAADEKQRDLALAALENCADFAPGLVRGLRVEFAPVACGDSLVGTLVKDEEDELDGNTHDALRGLALAGQLNRLVQNPPSIEPPFDRARFDQFMKEQLAPWIVEQAKAVHQLMQAGAQLQGYGKGVVAIEAGLADMRFVEVVRAVPLPESLANDAELRDVYYGALDAELEPRKRRGRDAALVGLKILSEVGVLSDPRLNRARSLLSKLYNGRRIDALDALIVPELGAPASDTVAQRLAASLPTFYAGVILREEDPGEGEFLHALVSQGLPAVHRDKLDAESLSPDARLLAAQAFFKSGQLYWRASDFELVRQFLRQPIAGDGGKSAALLLSAAKPLAKGPSDAIHMMAEGPAPRGPFDVSSLDALARTQSPFAGAAAFDAAYLLELAPPTEQTKPFWKSLQKRYQNAAQRLTGAERQRALDAAAAAGDTLKAVQ